MRIHNAFDTYTVYQTSDGSTVSVASDGSYAEFISNGQNKNTSNLYVNPRYSYANIKNKQCRITWDVTCSDLDTMDGTNDSGNISFGLFTVQEQTSGGISVYRKSKKDVATYANLLGHHTVEFVPAEFLSGQTEADYFGWHFGFRSNTSGRTIRINQFDFEVYE